MKNNKISKNLISYLINKYKTDVHMNINYASLIYLSFFIELESFLILYSIIPYNYFKNIKEAKNITSDNIDDLYIDNIDNSFL